MKKFENYSKFINHLLTSIKNDKRIAIFEDEWEHDDINYIMGTLDNENKDKYVHYFISGETYNLKELAGLLITKFSDEYSINFHWVHMYHDDGTDDYVHAIEIKPYLDVIDNRSEVDKEDNIKKWFELNGDEGHHAKATKTDATFTGLLEYIREHGNEVFCNVYDYCTNHDYEYENEEDYSEFETGAREEVTMELFKRFHLEWDENGHWTIK